MTQITNLRSLLRIKESKVRIRINFSCQRITTLFCSDKNSLMAMTVLVAEVLGRLMRV